jgi:hypothetical protein
MKKPSSGPKKAASTTPAKVGDSRPLAPHEIALSPNIQSATAIYFWGKLGGKPDLQSLVTDLHDITRKVQGGDLAPVEAMLFGQAMALQSIFVTLARRASTNDSIKPFQVNLTLALKAQAQCRATLEALAEIKNPRPVAFVKQANIAQQQQVNYGTPPVSSEVSTAGGDPSPSARAGENPSRTNELLEHQDGNQLDARTASSAGGADPVVATVGTVDRPAHG